MYINNCAQIDYSGKGHLKYYNRNRAFLKGFFTVLKNYNILTKDGGEKRGKAVKMSRTPQAAEGSQRWTGWVW